MTEYKECFPTSLDYVPIGRRLLRADTLEQCEIPIYERDIAVRSRVIPKGGAVPTGITEAEELIVPVIEIAANPTVKMSEVRQRRYDICQQAIHRSKDSLARQEDVEVFKVINAAVPCEQSVHINGTVQPHNLLLTMRLIEEHELKVDKFVMHPARLTDLRGWDNTVQQLDLYPLDVLYETRVAGTFMGVEILVSTMCAKNVVYTMAPKEFVGVIPIRQDVTVIPADDPKRMRVGWVVFKELGFGVLNEYAIARITLTPELTSDDRILKLADQLCGVDANLLYSEFESLISKYKKLIMRSSGANNPVCQVNSEDVGANLNSWKSARADAELEEKE